jgi:putative heme-binding domain-containing protein
VNFGLRDALVLQLAPRPEPQDRDKFLWGVESDQPQVVGAALGALEQLPRDVAADHLVPLLRLLQRALHEPRDGALRARTTALITRQEGRTFDVREGATTVQGLRQTYQPIFAWFEQAYPKLAATLSGSAVDLSAWRARLKGVDWPRGDPARGAALFQARACQTCHTGQRALGPDLTGVTSRFTREDLFTAIVAPSLDVSPLYRTTLIATHDGQVHSGLVAFESADGVILQTGAATTVRIATPDIAERRPGTRSLMPEGLLQDLTSSDLADLYRYLQTLAPRALSAR